MGIAAHRTALFGAIGLALGAGPALAQNQDKELIAEVIRKANAGEPEGGFCDTTPWPV
jgi:hypothetical protein